MTYCKSPQLALIYGNYNNPLQPYLTNWANCLAASEIQINIFSNSLITITTPKPEKVFELSQPLGKFGTIINFIKYFTKAPNYFYKLLVKDIDLSIKNKVNIWSRYAPLLIREPKIIHLVNSYIYPNYSFFIRKLKSISIVSFRGYDVVVRPFSDEIWSKILIDMFQQCDYLHYVSNYLKEEGLKLGAPPEKALVIYPGIDVDFYRPNKSNKYNPNNKMITIVSVGRLIWQKGLINALNAINIILNNGYNIQYWIVGDGGEKDHLYFWRRRLGIEKNVKFFGFQTPIQIRSLLNSSDIFVQPSVTEAIPVAAMEAGAMELPVIASKVGGLPELIDHDVTGLLVPPNNPTALAEAIMALADDKDKRTEMGKQGRIKIVREFSLEVETKEWVKLYKKAMTYVE